MHPAVTNGAYDVARIRAGFPDPRRCRSTASRWSISTTRRRRRSRKAVLDRIQQAYTSEYANVHRGLHYLANAATEGYEGAREKVRAFLNAPRPEEIIFTRNATEAINLVAYTFARERIKPGDEIVLSIMEHHSNIVPWHFLRERQGAVIKWAPVDEEGNFLLDEFEKLLTPRTKMVAMTHMSNVLGTIVPVKEVVKLAHAPRHSGAGRRQPGGGASRGRRAGHRLRLLRLHRPQALRPDRHRRAVGQVRASRRDAAVQRRRRDDPRGVRGPRHLWRAAAPVRGRHAADRAGDRAWRRDRLCQVDRQGRASGRTRPTWSTYAHERLREINSLRIIGTAKDKGPIVSFEMKGAHPHDVATVIDRAGVAVRAGTHCVMPLLARYGVTATCRASFALYNTSDESITSRRR